VGNSKWGDGEFRGPLAEEEKGDWIKGERWNEDKETTGSLEDWLIGCLFRRATLTESTIDARE